MKILILTQGIQNRPVLLQGLEMAKNYASTIGIAFEYSFKETTKQFSSYSFNNAAVGSAVAIRGEEILDEVDGDYKIACLIFDWTKISPQPTNPVQIPILKNGCNPIQIPEQWYGIIYPEVLADYFLHEVCHAGYFFKGDTANDVTHNQGITPAWSNKQPHEYYLFLLAQLKPWLETVPVTTRPTLRLRSPNKDAVKELQTILRIKVDGDFGPITLQAVKVFQAKNNLLPDGVVGPKTWTELLKKKPNDMIVSPAGLALITSFEGYRSTPYQDTGGVWTIGYGNTYDLQGRPITGQTPAVTRQQALELFNGAIGDFTTFLNQSIDVELNQNQFDACASLCYNIGSGNFQRSRLLKNINLKTPILQEYFTGWNQDQTGKVLASLTARRKVEYALYKKS